MLGENTLVFTRKGFKTVSELNLYDEVLTGYGTYEPVIEMGPWEKVDYVVQFNTGECIACSDSVLWDAYLLESGTKSFIYTDEIENGKYACNRIMSLEKGDKHPIYPPYEYGVVVPTCIPDVYIASSKEVKLQLFAGLVDSPICEASDSTGVYTFYTRYEELARGIVTLIRSLGWGISYENNKGVHCVTANITQYEDEIPIKDEYKLNIGKAVHYKDVRILGTFDCDEEIYGRKIKVNGGSLLVGYSLIPIS